MDPRAWLDPVMRHLLAIPGWVVEQLDGEVVEGNDLQPTDVYPLVAASARHPEAHLALEPGLHYHVDGQRVVAYQLRGRTAFAVGGINASEDQKAALLEAFTDRNQQAGVRRQLLFPVRASERERIKSVGYPSIQVGVEAWLDLAELTFRGNRYVGVRNMCNRARRSGVGVTEVAAGTDAAELQAIHDRWLEKKKPSWRMKLLIGSLGLDQPFDRRYFVARSQERIEGFVTVLPGGEGVWGLDVMCRRPDAAAGTMELLIVSVVETLRAEGASHLSLGPCPMAGVASGGKRPLLRGVFRFLFTSRLGNTLFGFANLYRFKNKFRPRWEPVYFAAWPRLSWWALYQGCRMWGLY